MSSSEGADIVLRRAAEALASAMETGALESIPDAALQAVMAQAVRVYSAKRQDPDSEGSSAGVFPEGVDVTATDVSITAMSMLKAAEMEVFELGLWQSWAGNI